MCIRAGEGDFVRKAAVARPAWGRGRPNVAGFCPTSRSTSSTSTTRRFTTRIVEADRGSRTIGVDDAAARLVQPGDEVIVPSHAQMSPEEARVHVPEVAPMGDGNRIMGPAA